MKLEDLLTRLEQIHSDIASSSDTWIREEHYRPWLEKYNSIIDILSKELKRSLPKRGISTTDYSTTGKTITNKTILSFQEDIKRTCKIIVDELQNAKDENNKFQCFKIGCKCPHEIKGNAYKFFIGMPFADNYKDSYEYGIKNLLTSHGIEENRIFKADENFAKVDIMCKICRAIQDAEHIIINITDQNPNVMFELGLAYGLNKKVFLIKDATSSVVSDLNGLEYIEYTHAGDLNNKLKTRFEDLGII